MANDAMKLTSMVVHLGSHGLLHSPETFSMMTGTSHRNRARPKART
jgi:hypothetical protein